MAEQKQPDYKASNEQEALLGKLAELNKLLSKVGPGERNGRTLIYRESLHRFADRLHDDLLRAQSAQLDEIIGLLCLGRATAGDIAGVNLAALHQRINEPSGEGYDHPYSPNTESDDEARRKVIRAEIAAVQRQLDELERAELLAEAKRRVEQLETQTNTNGKVEGDA